MGLFGFRIRRSKADAILNISQNKNRDKAGSSLRSSYESHPVDGGCILIRPVSDDQVFELDRSEPTIVPTRRADADASPVRWTATASYEAPADFINSKARPTQFDYKVFQTDPLSEAHIILDSMAEAAPIGGSVVEAAVEVPVPEAPVQSTFIAETPAEEAAPAVETAIREAAVEEIPAEEIVAPCETVAEAAVEEPVPEITVQAAPVAEVPAEEIVPVAEAAVEEPVLEEHLEEETVAEPAAVAEDAIIDGLIDVDDDAPAPVFDMGVCEVPAAPVSPAPAVEEAETGAEQDSAPVAPVREIAEAASAAAILGAACAAVAADAVRASVEEAEESARMASEMGSAVAGATIVALASAANAAGAVMDACRRNAVEQVIAEIVYADSVAASLEAAVAIGSEEEPVCEADSGVPEAEPVSMTVTIDASGDASEQEDCSYLLNPGYMSPNMAMTDTAVMERAPISMRSIDDPVPPIGYDPADDELCGPDDLEHGREDASDDSSPGASVEAPAAEARPETAAEYANALFGADVVKHADAAKPDVDAFDVRAVMNGSLTLGQVESRSRSVVRRSAPRPAEAPVPEAPAMEEIAPAEKRLSEAEIGSSVAAILRGDVPSCPEVRDEPAPETVAPKAPAKRIPINPADVSAILFS